MVELSEKQLVEKANMALVLMVEGEERRPIEVRFMGGKQGKCQGTSLAVCTPLYTLSIIHILYSFYFKFEL